MNNTIPTSNHPYHPTRLGAGILLTVGLLSGGINVLAQGPELGIRKSVLLEWPVTESQYVPVAADSADGPWKPFLQPIVQTDGRNRLTVPSDSSHAFFNLAEGAYQFEDFSTSAFDNWTQGTRMPGFGGIVTALTADGALRIQDNNTGWPLMGFYLNDSGCTDFVMSVDLLEWSGVEQFVLLGRAGAVNVPSGVFGALTVNWKDRGVPGEGILWMWDGDRLTGREPTNFILQIDPAVDYRLVMSGVGPLLTLRLYALPNTTTPVAPTLSFLTSRKQGVPIFAVEGDERNGRLDLTIDNLHVVSVAP